MGCKLLNDVGIYRLIFYGQSFGRGKTMSIGRTLHAGEMGSDFYSSTTPNWAKCRPLLPHMIASNHSHYIVKKTKVQGSAVAEEKHFLQTEN